MEREPLVIEWVPPAYAQAMERVPLLARAQATPPVGAKGTVVALVEGKHWVGATVARAGQKVPRAVGAADAR